MPQSKSEDGVATIKFLDHTMHGIVRDVALWEQLEHQTYQHEEKILQQKSLCIIKIYFT